MDSNYNEEVDRNVDFDSEYEMMPMPIVPMFMPGMNMGMMENGMNPEMMRAYNFQDMGMFPMMPPQMAGLNFPDFYDEEITEDDSSELPRKKKQKKEKYGYQKQVNRILNQIKRYNPGVFRYLRMYGVPYYAAERIVRRVIRLTLMYSEY
ncbi:hypothetical protein SH2C18_06120 [Clostridium sediminicola]|uniref:hypothetical protein n=1 Tax=Clostridium sediminicola TaxID=3114879 RepID=UPI0031F1E525